MTTSENKMIPGRCYEHLTDFSSPEVSFPLSESHIYNREQLYAGL